MSNSGECLPIAYRMQREGSQVAVYLHNPRYAQGYEGMLTKIRLQQVKSTLKKSDLVIFDITRPNERYRSDPNPVMAKRDAALLSMFGLKATERSVFGPVAERMMQDAQVVGCARFSEEAELDRMLGYKLAKQIGLRVPESHEFKNFNEGAKFLQAHSGDLWICKPQENEGFTYLEQWPGELLTKMQGEWKEKCKKSWSYILQKVLPKGSVEIDYQGWFDGKVFTTLSYTMEDKFWLTGNYSIQIGCQNTIVWQPKQMNTNGFLHKPLTKIVPHLLNSGYRGPVNITAMVSRSDQSVNWLEATFRFGYDALYAELAMLEDPITTFFYSGFRGKFKKGFAAAERVTIPPFPYHDDRLLEVMAKGVDIVNAAETQWFWMEDVRKSKSGWLECPGADAIIGVVTHVADTIEEASNGVYAKIPKIKIGAKKQVRTDLGDRAQRHIARLKQWNFIVS